MAKNQEVPTRESLPYDSLAGINQDGSVTKLVIGPVAVIALALVLIVLVRLTQKRRERAEMEATLDDVSKDITTQMDDTAGRPAA